MDDKIQKELKEVQQKLDSIEKKPQMILKIQELGREHSKKMVERPINHSYEMMWYNIDI